MQIQNRNHLDDAEFTTQEATIFGKLLVVNFVYPELQQMISPLTDSDIKGKLCEMLIREMFKADCIEFTRERNTYDNTTKYRARTIIMPREEVRYLKKGKLIL